jgi:SAM-dependent methyltransferase
MLNTIERVNNGKLDEILAERSGIQLDIGSGGNKMGPEFVGMDIRPLPGVDIVHDVTKFPWPLPDESVVRAVCSHLVEHIPPHSSDSKIVNLIELLLHKGVITDEEAREFIGEWDDRTPRFLRFMDEVWRVLKYDGQFAIMCPYGWSPGQQQDPSHVNSNNENTWRYFDPLMQGPNYPTGFLWKIYKPKPWAVERVYYAPEGNMEVLLRKRREDPSYYE